MTSVTAPRVQLSLGYSYDAVGNVTSRRNDRYGVVKYYIGGLYEEKAKDGRALERTSYIFAIDDQPVAMVVRSGSGSDTYYFSRDPLGSTVRIADDRLAVIQELDYDAWGRRRDPRTLAYNVWDIKDDHGFTGHEHIDMFDMVNMDGRIYDPVAGRFLTPDPFVQAPGFTQSLNRYAYCLNNPLSLVDPSGYSWFSRNWKSLVSAAVGIAVGAATLGAGATAGAAIAAGAASGAASALTGALLNGSNIGQIAKATFWGGFWGAASGYLNNLSADEDFIASLFKHAFTEGALEGAQGGNVMHGLYMGAVSALSNKALQAKFMTDSGKTLQIVASSVVGGTMEEIGGGKFANGATTAAFSMIFNEIMHRGPTKEQVKSAYDFYKESFEKYETVASIYAALGGDIAYYAKTQPQFYQNACAARLSYAFNKAGIKIPRNKWTQQGKGKLNYFLKASDMARWMKRRWGAPSLVTKVKQLTTGFTTQTGFGHNISGHVSVMYKGNDCTNVIENYFSQGASTSIWYGR